MSSSSGRALTSSSVRSNHSNRVAGQTQMDARLNAEFEESQKQFDYSTSTDAANRSRNDDNSPIPSSAVSDYLQRIQRGNLIQPFGCLLVIRDVGFALIAYSENAPEMLDLPHSVPSLDQREALAIGIDARSLFNSSGAAALQKAAAYGEINLLNPILVHCKSSGKPLYAILHRIEEGIVIDLEPVNTSDLATAAGALKSYKLASKAISQLQSLPSGNIQLLCDVLVRELGDLTGYDRVMAYKFHEDEHGEVISECRKSDLEPYVGLHFPATDIPQASRFLFMKNKVRMICNCHALPVHVKQDKRLGQPLSLCGSTLRAPHGCHAQYMANMGSIASLVMSVTVNEDAIDAGSDEQQKARKLWGLIVCHHTSSRFVPFPLRYACEFLLQVFSMQLNKEVDLASQTREKQVVHVQSVLCDMILRDAPERIFTQSPNVMDLVRCDGAALYYRNRCWMLGITPTERQIRDISSWLIKHHHDTTGLSTESLLEAGFPGSYALGDAVCGMAAIKITSKDFVFWFRSHAAKEIKWGGVKHDSIEGDDDGRKMHPRSSFKAFLEVIKQRSLPWEDVEMDAIHSLQLILRGSLHDDAEKSISQVSGNALLNEVEKIKVMDDLQLVTNEMVRLIETASVPILAVDASGKVSGWNMKAAELTGLPVQQAIGTYLIDLVEDDSIEVIKSMLVLAMEGNEKQNVEFKLKRFGRWEKNDPLILVVNACCIHDVKNDVVGVCFVAQDVTLQKMMMDRFSRVQGDYIAILKNPGALIPPIFITDEHGLCIEWNMAMQKLSGLKREDAINKILVGEVFSNMNYGCQVKDANVLTKLNIMLNNVIAGRKSDKLVFGFYGLSNKYIEVLLSASKRTNHEDKTTGVFCFLHVASPELRQAFKAQQVLEKATTDSLNELRYIRHEVKNPLHGIVFMQNLMETSDLTPSQRQILKTSTLCREQLAKALDDMDLRDIEECYLNMNMVEFNLGEALEAVRLQGMFVSQQSKTPLIHKLTTDFSSMYLYGDGLRLQQALADLLLSTFQLTAPSERPIELRAIPRMELIGTALQIIHLEIRVSHPEPCIPDALIKEMFSLRHEGARESLGLNISHKLIKIMNGTIEYVREEVPPAFVVRIEFPVVRRKRGKFSS